MALISGLYICSLLWVCFQWNPWLHGILSSEVRVNRSSAQQECENYGGLLSYKTFLKENVSDNLNGIYKQLDETDSAWVSGLVNYSQFVSWQGCYLKNAVQVTKETDTFNMTEKSVSSCFNPCKETDHLLYIGISLHKRNGNECYCFSEVDVNLIYNYFGDGIIFKRSYKENTFYGSMMLEICNSTQDLINVYKRVDITQTPFIESYGQCVFVNKVTQTNNFTIEYGTRSCFAHGEWSQNGYICVGMGTHNLNHASCINSTSTSEKHCIIHASVDWYQAQKQCNRLNGMLVGLISKDMEQHLQTDVMYWTGLFREFKIIPSSFEISEGDSCLSVRKIKTEFVLEPAQCSDVKFKLCQNGNISSECLNNYTVTLTDNAVKRLNVSDTFETNLTTSLTFNGVLLLISVGLAILLYRRRRKTAPSLDRLTCEKATTTTRSNDTLADDSVFYAVDSDEYHDDSHYYSCPDKTATGKGSRENKYDHSHDSGAKQYDHICLRNASHQHVRHSDNINVSDYSHIINATHQNVCHGDNINVSNYSHINASHQHVCHGDNINVSDYSHTNALAKATASNQTIYEEIREQALYRKTETEV